jgi:hypothetical protein
MKRSGGGGGGGREAAGGAKEWEAEQLHDEMGLTLIV